MAAHKASIVNSTVSVANFIQMMDASVHPLHYFQLLNLNDQGCMLLWCNLSQQLSHMFIPPWWDGGGNQKKESEKNYELR